VAVHAHPPCMGRGVCGQHSLAVHVRPPCIGRGVSGQHSVAVHAHPPCMGRGVCGQHSVAVHAHPPCHGRGHVIRHHMVITIHHHSAKLITCAPAFHYSRPSTAGAGTGIRMWLAGGAGVMQPWGEEANLRGTVSLGGTSMAARRHRGTKVEVVGCGQLTNNSIGLPWICSYIVVLHLPGICLFEEDVG